MDAQTGIIYIPERRILKFKQAIYDLLLSAREHKRVPVRKIAILVGQIISMSIVIGQISQIMIRYLSADILNAKHWYAYIQLGADIYEQLLFRTKTLKF